MISSVIIWPTKSPLGEESSGVRAKHCSESVSPRAGYSSTLRCTSARAYHLVRKCAASAQQAALGGLCARSACCAETPVIPRLAFAGRAARTWTRCGFVQNVLRWEACLGDRGPQSSEAVHPQTCDGYPDLQERMARTASRHQMLTCARRGGLGGNCPCCV